MADAGDSKASVASKPNPHGRIDDPYIKWIELNSDETGMGRDLLRRTSPVTDDEMLLNDGVDRMMGVVSPQGTDGLRVSKWSKRNA